MVVTILQILTGIKAACLLTDNTNATSASEQTILVAGRYNCVFQDQVNHRYEIATKECPITHDGNDCCFKYAIARYDSSEKRIHKFSGTYSPDIVLESIAFCNNVRAMCEDLDTQKRMSYIYEYINLCIPVAISSYLHKCSVGLQLDALRSYLQPPLPWDTSEEPSQNYSMSLSKVIRSLHRMNDRLYRFYSESPSFIVSKLGTLFGLKGVVYNAIDRIFHEEYYRRNEIVRIAAKSIYVVLLEMHGDNCLRLFQLHDLCMESVNEHIHIPLVRTLSENVSELMGKRHQAGRR